MIAVILYILPLAVATINQESAIGDKGEIANQFGELMSGFADTLNELVGSETKKEAVDELISDEEVNELMQKVSQWFQDGDLTPDELINVANLSFAGKFNTSPQLSMCIGKYTTCTLEQCTLSTKNYEAYNPEMLSCLGKCVPTFISCIAWAGASPTSTEF